MELEKGTQKDLENRLEKDPEIQQSPSQVVLMQPTSG
jgi:hypothetical protein